MTVVLPPKNAGIQQRVSSHMWLVQGLPGREQGTMHVISYQSTIYMYTLKPNEPMSRALKANGDCSVGLKLCHSDKSDQEEKADNITSF
jgi:hypothetical protein